MTRRPIPATPADACQRHGCTRTDGLIGGYCSDTCLQADAPEGPPTLVLAPSKPLGIGISWMERQPVHLPDL